MVVPSAIVALSGVILTVLKVMVFSNVEFKKLLVLPVSTRTDIVFPFNTPCNFRVFLLIEVVNACRDTSTDCLDGQYTHPILQWHQEIQVPHLLLE